MEIKTLSYEKIKNMITDVQMNESELLEIVNTLMEDPRKNVQTLGHSLLKKRQKEEAEIERVRAMYNFDKSFGNYRYVAGVDEVGRGPFAGPIVAASVILNLESEDLNNLILGIKDSKQLSPSSREELSEIIKNRAAAYNISAIDNKNIDKFGVGWCNQEVLRRACTGLKVPADLVLSDGYAVKNLNIKNEFVIKGDAKSASIACASIVAKIFRDNLMKEYSKIYPQYGFESNAGYGTEAHISAIKKFGITEIHRISFLKNHL